MSDYPENVGIKLKYEPFNENQLLKLKHDLPVKTILRVYGLAGVGKGTLSEQLSGSLDIPNIESSFILRCITLAYLKEKLPLTAKNTELILDKINVTLNKNALFFTLDDKIVTRNELKSSEVDSNVTTYSSNSFVREKFDQILQNVVLNAGIPCIADGRGSHEPYLVEAEQQGFKVIRILLDANDKVKAERYFAGYVAKQLLQNPDFKITDEQKEKILLEFEQTIVKRNQLDIQNILDKNLGLISHDSGIIDTSELNPKQVLETALNYIYKGVIAEN